MEKRQEEITTLGFSGLAPIVAGVVTMWLSPIIVPTWVALNIHTIVLTYAGIIAAYMAGMGGGAILTDTTTNTKEPFWPGMVAALLAWIAIIPNGFLIFTIPAAWRYGIIIFVLIYLLLRDLRAVANKQLPEWYGRLRIRLTIWASTTLLLIALRLALMGYT